MVFVEVRQWWWKACGGCGKAVRWRSWWWLAALGSADHGGFWFGSEVSGGVCGGFAVVVRW